MNTGRVSNKQNDSVMAEPNTSIADQHKIIQLDLNRALYVVRQSHLSSK